MNIYTLTADLVERNTNTTNAILKGLDETTDYKKVKKITKATHNYCREIFKTCDLYESFIHRVPNANARKQLLKAIYKQRTLLIKLIQLVDRREKREENEVKKWQTTHNH